MMLNKEAFGFFCHRIGRVIFAINEANAVDTFGVDLLSTAVHDFRHTMRSRVYQVVP